MILPQGADPVAVCIREVDSPRGKVAQAERMEQLLDNKWFYWLVTGLMAALWAALLYFIKRQRDSDDARFKAIEKRQEDNRDRINRLISELPITYTLRDEFLRVTTAQNSKLDKITDMIGTIGADIASLKSRNDD